VTVPHRDSDRNTSTIPASARLLVSEPDAATMFSTSLPTFRSWVKDGLVQPVALPHGIRRNLYLMSELSALADKLAGR
jgi:hypothetical protein